MRTIFQVHNRNANLAKEDNKYGPPGGTKTWVRFEPHDFARIIFHIMACKGRFGVH